MTGYGPTSTSMPAPNDLYRYWRADRKTVILAANAFNGNVLEFYDDSQALKNIIPKSVFQEIRGRFGNKYFVDEEEWRRRRRARRRRLWIASVAGDAPSSRECRCNSASFRSWR